MERRVSGKWSKSNYISTDTIRITKLWQCLANVKRREYYKVPTSTNFPVTREREGENEREKSTVVVMLYLRFMRSVIIIRKIQLSPLYSQRERDIHTACILSTNQKRMYVCKCGLNAAGRHKTHSKSVQMPSTTTMHIFLWLLLLLLL